MRVLLLVNIEIWGSSPVLFKDLLRNTGKINYLYVWIRIAPKIFEGIHLPLDPTVRVTPAAEYVNGLVIDFHCGIAFVHRATKNDCIFIGIRNYSKLLMVHANVPAILDNSNMYIHPSISDEIRKKVQPLESKIISVLFVKALQKSFFYQSIAFFVPLVYSLYVLIGELRRGNHLDMAAVFYQGRNSF